ncbi:MAG: hypothetical protein R2883_06185 [Caldisericia bacterium]
MEHKTEYDAENNILYLTIEGTLSTSEDVNYINNKNVECYNRIGKKVWVAINSSKLVTKSTKAVTEFSKTNEANSSKYVMGQCFYEISGLQKVMMSLFNTFTGKRSVPFNTKEEATAWILEEQKKVGKEAPIK